LRAKPGVRSAFRSVGGCEHDSAARRALDGGDPARAPRGEHNSPLSDALFWPVAQHAGWSPLRITGIMFAAPCARASDRLSLAAVRAVLVRAPCAEPCACARRIDRRAAVRPGDGAARVCSGQGTLVARDAGRPWPAGECATRGGAGGWASACERLSLFAAVRALLVVHAPRSPASPPCAPGARDACPGVRLPRLLSTRSRLRGCEHASAHGYPDRVKQVEEQLLDQGEQVERT